MKKTMSRAAIFFLAAAFFVGGTKPSGAAISTNASANVVIGQANMTAGLPNNGGNPDASAQGFYLSREIATDGTKLIAVDYYNNRVLIFNSIPTTSNASADVVIGQQNMAGDSINQGGSTTDTTLWTPTGVFFDGSRLFLTDAGNNRVLIYNSIPTSNNAPADVVVGQPNMTSGAENQGGAAAANTLSGPNGVFSTGGKLFISDYGNNRVLIYNSIPTGNGASADVVIGQPDMTSSNANQGGSVSANTISGPSYIHFNGKKLFVADRDNHRVLIYNSIPVTNNASANVVIGQPNMTSNTENQGGAVAANTLNYPRILMPYGPKLIVADSNNNRVLVYNTIPTSNNASADVVIGQPDLTSNGENQGAGLWTPAANTLYSPRGLVVNDSKLFVSDYMNSRIVIYDNFGAQWAIGNKHSRKLSGDETISVKKKKIQFSGKKKVYKNGRVRIYRDGALVKTAKIKKSGKWKATFGDSGSAVKDFVVRYYNKNNILQMNSETYTLGIRTGASALTLKKATVSGSAVSEKKNEPKNMPGKFEALENSFRGN